MQFRATDDQIKKLLTLVHDASSPVGMGFMHYSPGPADPQGIALMFDQLVKHRRIDVDYLNGRMIKISLKLVESSADGLHTVDNGHGGCRADYQSWATKYRAWDDLLLAAGITDVL